MLTCRCVGDLLRQLDLHDQLYEQVKNEIGEEEALPLFDELTRLPLKSSRAVTRLGSYSFKGPRPLAIRLQFTQEEASLRQTLLHEIAHFLDHQTTTPGQTYRNPHGRNWQHWLRQIGGQGRAENSPAMQSLYQQRLKPVARCEQCGFQLKRLRRLPRGRRWVHSHCGGLLVPLD
jgi:hypothetical protein